MNEEKNNLNTALDSIEALNNFRYRMQNAFFENLDELMDENTPAVIKNGTARLSELSQKEIEMEKELMNQVKDCVNNRNRHNSAGETTWGTTSNNTRSDYHKINIPSDVKEFSVPINLTNPYDEPQTVTIDITPLQEKGGPSIIIDQFTVENRTLVLKPKSTKKVIATLSDTRFLHGGKHYVSELFIGGKKPYVVRLLFSIIKNDALEISIQS